MGVGNVREFVKKKLLAVYLALKARRKKVAVIAVLALFLMNYSHPVAAESWTDKIADGIQSIFDSIVNAIKGVIEMIGNAILWPYRQFSVGMVQTWHWSWEKFGPLAIIITLLVGGAAIYIILFWVEQYIQQITNN